MVALRLPQPGDFQHRGDAGAVIVGPVHHGSVWLSSQVVIVRADDDDLAAVFGIGAGQQAQDVAGLNIFLLFDYHGQARGDRERRGGKAQAQTVQRIVCADEQILSDVFRDQVSGDGLGHPGGLAVSAPAEWLSLFLLPVQQQQPTDLVLNGLAVDIVVVGVAAQQDFADQVETGIVCVQALVQPDDRPFSLSRADVAAGEGAVIAAIGVGAGERLSGGRDNGESGRLYDAPVGCGKVLKVVAVHAGRLQSILGQGGGDIVARGSPAGGTGLAAGQFVAGEIGDVLQRLLLVELEGAVGIVAGAHRLPHDDLRRAGRGPRVVGDARAGRRRQLELLDGRLGRFLGRGWTEQSPQVDQDAGLHDCQDGDQVDECAAVEARAVAVCFIHCLFCFWGLSMI